MKLPRRQIASVIARLNPKLNTQQLADTVAAYLLSEGRTAELDPLMRDVMEERAAEGVIEVKALSAHALSQPLLADIKNEVKKIYPKARRIIVSPVLEPSVVGGLRLEFANHQLDLSLKTKLDHLRELITYGKD